MMSSVRGLTSTWLLPVVLALVGCPPVSGDDDDSADTDQEPLAPGHLGGLDLLEIVREDTGDSMISTRIWGLHDPPAPDDRWYGGWAWVTEILADYGDCLLIDTLPAHTCEPACTSEQFCAAEGCVDWPELVTAGAIEVTGLTEDLLFVPTDLGWYTLDGELPDDLHEPGATVTMEAEGGEVPAFEASAVAPADLGPTLDCDSPLEAGQDFVISWTPTPGSFRVRLEVIAVYHAGNGPMLLCDVDDAAGTLVVPTDVVDVWLPYRTPAETFQVTRYAQAEGSVGDGRSVVLGIGAQRACW